MDTLKHSEQHLLVLILILHFCQIFLIRQTPETDNFPGMQAELNTCCVHPQPTYQDDRPFKLTDYKKSGFQLGVESSVPEKRRKTNLTRSQTHLVKMH